MLTRSLLFTVLFAAFGTSAQIPKGALTLWLCADSGVRSDRSGVQEWKDLNGNGLHAVTITAKAPTRIASSLNGLPTVRFNGFDNGLVTPPCATFPNKRGRIVIVTRCKGRSATS